MKKDLTNVCPGGPAWDALVNHPRIGEYEAMKDWLENNGEVRDVEQVLEKLSMASDTTMTPADRLQKKLLDFLREFGFDVKEADNLIIDLANKTIKLDPSKPEQMAKALATPLTDMLSQSSYFATVYNGIKSTERFNSLVQEYRVKFPEAKWSDVKRMAAKQIMRELLESGFSERLIKELNLQKSIIDKIKDFIVKLIKTLVDADWAAIQPKIKEIVDKTFAGEDFIRLTKKEGYKLVKFQEAFNENDIAHDIMTRIGTKYGIVLTGSIAYSTQGTVYRKIEIVVHDLDFVNDGLTLEELDNLVFENYPDAIRAVEIITKGNRTDTYLVPPRGFALSNVVYRQVTDKETGRTKNTKVESYTLINKETGEIAGTYNLRTTIKTDGSKVESEETTGVKAMLVDFFSSDAQSQKAAFEHPFTGNDGKKYTVKLSHYSEPFKAKLEWGRFKDIWDYNRFMPFDHMIPSEERKKNYQESINKPAIDALFEENPELEKIGTREQYDEYLKTVFPNSIVKEIHYSGIREGASETSRYYTNQKDYAAKYGRVRVVLLDVKNPHNETVYGLHNGVVEVIQRTRMTPEQDAIIGKEGPNITMGAIAQEMMQADEEGYPITSEEAMLRIAQMDKRKTDVVYMLDNKNTHELGTDKDMRGFRDFVEGKVKDSGTVAYSRSGYWLHESAKRNLESRLLSAGYDFLGSPYGIIKDDLSRSDVERIQRHIDASNPPDRWIIRESKSGNWYIAGYKNKAVFNPDYWSPTTNRSGYFRENETVLGIDETEIASEKPMPLDNQGQSNNKGRDIINKLISRLSAQFGVDYQVISIDDAVSITAESVNPFRKEDAVTTPAFYFNGKVYFIGENIRTDIAFHEFSHPFVRAMMASNPKLFDKLYNDLLKSDEGRLIYETVVKNYPEFKDSDPMFKEEVLVRALAEKSDRAFNNLGVTEAFMKFVKDFMYAIKQMMRKTFGKKVNVSKLDTNTTLDELAQMIVEGKEFDLGNVDISQKSATAYARDTREDMADLSEVAPEDLTNLATQGFTAAIKTLRKMKESGDYEEMLKILSDETGFSNVQYIMDNLTKYTDRIENRVGEMINEQEYVFNHVEALVNTFYRLSKSIPKITKHLKELSKDKDNPANIKKAFAYSRILNYWGSYVSYALEVFKENGLQETNPISKLVSSINNQIVNGQTEVGIIYGEGVKKVLFETLLPIGDTLKRRFESMLATAVKYKYAQYAIDRIYEDYYGLTQSEYNEFNSLKDKGMTMSERYQKLKNKSLTNGAELTEEKMEMLLRGELNDANWANSFFEGYMYNDDYVVGGFSLFVKQAIDEVMVRAQKKYNEFSKDILDTLEKAGYSPSNIGELGKRVGFIDEIGIVDKDGNFVKKKVWTLKNKWKDYRASIPEMEYAINKAREEYERTKLDSDKEKLIQLIEAKKDHDIRYMHQENSPEYYNARKEFTKDSIGEKALFERDRILADIRRLQETLTDDEVFNVNNQIMEKWNEYRQLHSLYDSSTGEMKKGEELEIAKRLQEYRTRMRGFYTYTERPGAFDTALAKYEQHLKNKGVSQEDFEELRETWIANNTRIVLKESFYERRAQLLTDMKALLAKIKPLKPRPGEMSQSEIADKISEAYTVIFDRVSGFRDEDGQPNGNMISAGTAQKILEQQRIINDLRDKLIGISGLTRIEQRRLNELMQLDDLTPQEEVEFFALDQKRRGGLSKTDRAVLNGIFKDLDMLSSSRPTDYYVTQLNAFLSNIQSERVLRQFGSYVLDPEQANDLLSPKNRRILTELLQDPKFKLWFENNHLKKVKYDYKEKTDVVTYQRSYIWNIVKPSDPAYYETYQIRDADGNAVGEPLRGLPSLKFYNREVKQEFKTGYNPATGEIDLEVGVHVDNKGEWLPREDVADNIYRNEEYDKFVKDDQLGNEVLEKLKKHHLKNQEGLDRRSKLYLDFPRFERSNLELLQTQNVGKEKMSFFRNMIHRVRNFFKGSKEMPESGFGWSDEFKLVSLDIYDDREYNVPIQGMYDIDIADVSTDITNSMMRYMFSAEKNKKLTEILPTAVALKAVLNKQGDGMFRRVAGVHLTHNGEYAYRKEDNMKNRRKAVDNLINREFFGQTQTGFGSDSPFLHNLSQGLFQTASFGFFALNVPSAIKNWFGAKIQGLIEAGGGMYYNPVDFAKGEAWSTKTMFEISGQIYAKGPKSADVQLWEVFDPMLNIEQKARREGMSRTLLKDISEPVGVLLNFRKWTEMQASMQIFAGIMYNTKVDYKGKKISLIDAFEVKDGLLRLKEGVDPEWGITYDSEGEMKLGKKFLAKRNEIQAVIRNLQGAYDEFNQPEAQRYLAFRFISFLRRYLTTMLIDRFGFKWKNGRAVSRLQVGLGNSAEGWYVTLSRFLMDVFRMGPKKFRGMTPEERRSVLKTTFDFAVIILIWMLERFVFGWIPDDDERYEKLREKSGAMRGPFVTDDEWDFHMGGWMHNHALNLLMQIRSEQQQFIPFPGLGWDDYKEMYSDMGTSAAFGPTLDTYFTLVQDLYYLGSGSEKAWYQREVGPYAWQQEEGSKFLAHLAKGAGLTGTTWDPVMAIKNFQSVEQGFK